MCMIIYTFTKQGDDASKYDQSLYIYIRILISVYIDI